MKKQLHLLQAIFCLWVNNTVRTGVRVEVSVSVNRVRKIAPIIYICRVWVKCGSVGLNTGKMWERVWVISRVLPMHGKSVIGQNWKKINWRAVLTMSISFRSPCRRSIFVESGITTTFLAIANWRSTSGWRHWAPSRYSSKPQNVVVPLSVKSTPSS